MKHQRRPGKQIHPTQEKTDDSFKGTAVCAMKRSAEKTDDTKDAKRHATNGETSSSSSTSPPPASSNTTGSGASPAAALAPAQPPLDVSQHQQVMKFVVPNDKAGAVIGRGGESISRTRQISGAVVKIDKSEFGGDRTVTLQGTSVQIQAAYSDVMLNLQKAGVTDPTHMTATPRAADETTLQVLVPVGKVGGLIGKQGSSISEIRSTSGCFVKVASVQDTPPGATDRVVTLRGSPMAIQLAQQLIINKLATVEDRGGGGGGGGGHQQGQQPQQQYNNPGAYEWTHAHAQMGLQPPVISVSTPPHSPGTISRRACSSRAWAACSSSSRAWVDKGDRAGSRRSRCL